MASGPIAGTNKSVCLCCYDVQNTPNLVGVLVDSKISRAPALVLVCQECAKRIAQCWSNLANNIDALPKTGVPTVDDLREIARIRGSDKANDEPEGSEQ